MTVARTSSRESRSNPVEQTNPQHQLPSSIILIRFESQTRSNSKEGVTHARENVNEARLQMSDKVNPRCQGTFHLLLTNVPPSKIPKNTLVTINPG